VNEEALAQWSAVAPKTNKKERPVPQYVSVKLRDDGRIIRPKHVVVNYCTIFMLLWRSGSETRYY